MTAWEPKPGWDANDDDPPPETEKWRGDLHLPDWPENLAGPEYWLFKQQEDNDDDTDDKSKPKD